MNRRGPPRGLRLGPSLRPSRPRLRRAPRPALSEAEIVRRRLWDDSPDPIDVLEDGVFSAIRQTRRTLHVHSERIFLVGIGEGAAVAYRLGPELPRAVRRRGRDQRLAPGRLPSARPAQGVSRPPHPGRPRRVERPGPRPLHPPRRRHAPRRRPSRSPSSPTPVPTDSPRPCSPTSTPGSSTTAPPRSERSSPATVCPVFPTPPPPSRPLDEPAGTRPRSNVHARTRALHEESVNLGCPRDSLVSDRLI